MGERFGRFFERIRVGFGEIANSFGFDVSVKVGLSASLRLGNIGLGIGFGYDIQELGFDSYGQYVSDSGFSAGLSLGVVDIGNFSSVSRDYSWDDQASLELIDNTNIISGSVNAVVFQASVSINTHYHDRAAKVFGDAFKNF